MAISILADEPKKYRELLNELIEAKENKSIMFKNDTYTHTKILFPILIESAKNIIKINTNKFDKEFFMNENILNAFKDIYAKKHIKLEVLILKNNNSFDIEIEEVIQEYSDIFGQDFQFLLSKQEALSDFNNFMLIDDHSFRYEMITSSEVWEDVEAVGCINDIAYTKDLLDVFNGAFY